MRKRVVGLGVIAFVMIIVASYIWGFGYKLVGKIIEGRYWLATRGLGAAIVPNKGDLDVNYGADGGSSLENNGLKIGFIWPVYFESVWSWGIVNKTYWIVAQFKDNQRNGWVIVPVRGKLSYIKNSQLESQSLTIEEIEELLLPGDQIKLSVVYKFKDDIPENQVHSDLIELRVKARNISQQEAKWEIGSFPNKIYSDEAFKTSFQDSVELINLDDLWLISLRKM